MTTAAALRDLFLDYSDGKASIDELNLALTQLGRTARRDDAALFALWGQGELWLAEYSRGDLDEAELRRRIKGLAANTVRIGTTTQATGSTATAVPLQREVSLVAGKQGAGAHG